MYQNIFSRNQPYFGVLELNRCNFVSLNITAVTMKVTLTSELSLYPPASIKIF